MLGRFGALEIQMHVVLPGEADAAVPTEAESAKIEFETNTAEDVIAEDHSNNPGRLEIFAAFRRSYRQ